MKPQYKLAGSLALAVLALDQITKLLVQAHLKLYTSVEIVPGFFNLVHTLNKGAAFGFMNDRDTDWQVYFFIAAAAFAVLIIFNLLSKAENEGRLFVWALGAILGGALGNVADRLRLGEVVDFLDFAVGSYHWPAFNVADIAITCGSLALIFSFYARGRRKD